MGYRFSLWIVALVFGMLFSMLYFVNATSHVMPLPPSIANGAVITTPKISEQQATEIVSSHLQEKIAGFNGYGIYMSGEGYKHYSEFKARGIGIPLMFTHQNGTIFYVNSTTHDIFRSCTNTDENVCAYSSSELVNESRGRLVYVFDLSISSTKDGCGMPDIFIIDAISGDIIFSFIDDEPDTIARQCILVNAMNQK